MMNRLIKLTIPELEQQVQEINITNDEELENANWLAKEAKRLIKEVKANHKDEIKEYYDLHKEAKAREKEELKPLENAYSIIKKAIGGYMKIVEQRQLELVKQQEEEKAFFGEVITESKNIDMGGTHIRKTWKARIVDEEKVPIKYKHIVIRPVDVKELNALAQTFDGHIQIDGVEFYQEESVTIGR